jgi:NifU-like protein
VSFYPEKISERFYRTKRAGKPERTNAVGTGASFLCGTFVRFFLEIDVSTKEIRDAKYRSNACGFTIAAAEVLTEKICGKKLTELHGLENEELKTEIENALGIFPDGRNHCAEICFDALHAALNDFRVLQIEEFAGEKALICTCFGVSENEIENVIEQNRIETIEEVTEICNAGGGCGSCRMLIQELIDIYQMENFQP